MPSSTSSQGTRLSLLARARAQDAAAWRDLVHLYAPLVAHWCRRCGLAAHDAADCLQDVFTAVAASLDTYQPQGTSGSFRAWLWTVTRNKIRDFARRQARQASAAGGSSAQQALANFPDPATLPEDEPSDPGQLEELVRRGLDRVRDEFEPATWQAFWRTAIEGIPTAVVATELRVTPAAIRQSRSRVMRRLRQQFGDTG